MKKGPESELLERYLERCEKAGRQLGISVAKVAEWSESRAENTEHRKNEEAGLMLASLKPGTFLIVLDEHGKDLSSVDLAQFMEKCLNGSVPEMAFAIGGPDGHGKSLQDAASLVLRMGIMTWPHQLARVMLAEQLYRSITILSGHPYHRI